jgi:hypothetical protein
MEWRERVCDDPPSVFPFEIQASGAEQENQDIDLDLNWGSAGRI